MRQVRFEVFAQTPEQSLLRFFGQDGRLIGDRPLLATEVDRFVAEVEKGYKTVSPDLAALGRKLYAWLDGPTERWMAAAREGPPGLAVHIDGSERLRHLPWELIADDGDFLCALQASPLTPVRRVPAAGRTAETANRPLRLLLMACSPLDVEPVLEFEREEAMIFEATRKLAVELEVEESGSLQGLTERIESFGAGYFDVLHLSGHADVTDGGTPIFLMENDTGGLQRTDAGAIADAFAGSWPPLVFLSGCKTGQAVDQGALPSFCERLVADGAPAVLGWSLPVGDTAASLAAAELYHHLAAGKDVEEATARARAALRTSGSPFWHLLRLYTGRAPLRPFVTPPLTTKGRARIALRQARQEFLDAGAKSEVCPRGRFVGRRRALQRCLKVLRSVEGDDVYHEGVLLHGLGGLGKSSLAARLCDRLRGHGRLVWVGRVDETRFLQILGRGLNDAGAVALLNEPGLSLRQRLRNLLEAAEQTWLFVFDDFEQNVERDAGNAPRLDPADRAILEPAALGVLTDLLAAIRETRSASRALVTCRYQLSLPGPASLYPEEPGSFRGADLEKKLASLSALQPEAKTDPALRTRATELAAGNPRLLERLNTVLADAATDSEAILSALEATAESFREDVLLRTLLDLQPAAGRALLARLAVYGLPVRRAGVEAVADGQEMEPHLQRAVALGLAETAPGPEGEHLFYVSALLDPLLEPELTGDEMTEICGRAARFAWQAWWMEADSTTEGQLQETHRLAILGGECEIAAQVVVSAANRWYGLSRFREIEILCQATISQCPDYRVLHNLAKAEEILGKAGEARQHYEQALRQSPPIEADTAHGVIGEHSSLLSNLAGLIAQQGDVERALDLWNQSLALEEKIGNVKGKAATLHNMASVIAQQGDVERALDLWNQSLALEEKIGNVKGKAETLHQMAGVIAQQGDVERTLDPWTQSLALKEKIGDVQGKAATLANMAWAAGQQGDVERALDLWNQSLALLEKIGDVQGKAATLANMAWAAGQQGDRERNRHLNLEAVQALAAMRAWLDVITVLRNLGTSEDSGAPGFLAQALWLASRVQAPLEDSVETAAALFQKLEPTGEDALAVAMTAVALSQVRGRQHPQRERFQNYAFGMLGACATARQIPEDELQNWLESLPFADWQPALDRAVERIVGDSPWMFDRRAVR
jgi:tetratricopeptide (TPR) repeat protein